MLSSLGARATTSALAPPARLLFFLFFSLLPVMEKTLVYYVVDSTASLQYIQGRLAYDLFDSTVVLSRYDELRQFRSTMPLGV